MAEKLDEIKSQRSTTKASITRIKNTIDSKGSTLTLNDLECRLGILESYFKHLLALQQSFENLSCIDDSATRANYEELYISAKSAILTLISERRKDSQLPELERSVVIQSASAPLHKIKLPQFSGKYSDYPNFMGIFKKSIHSNMHYDNIEKCNILVNSLGGSAKHAVREFQITEENYEKILKHLDDRFNNKTLMFQELISELFNLPKISKISSSQLRSLVDNVNAIFSSMKSIGNETDICNAMIIHVVLGKLDSDSQAKWEDSLNFSELFKWSDCAAVLSKRCQFLECRESKFGHGSHSIKFTHDKQKSPTYSRAQSSTALTASQERNSHCTFCNGKNHLIYKCSKFSELPVMDRFAKAKELGLCINCLAKGHSVKKCSASKCKICSSPHHSLLHRFSKQTSSDERSSNLGDAGESSSYLSSSCQNSIVESSDSDSIILATAVVLIKNNAGELKPVRALLDSGSQSNFITESMIQMLALKKSKLCTNISGIGNSKTKVRYSAFATIQSRYKGFSSNLEFLVLPSIAGILPDTNLSIENWNIPNNLNLADPLFYKQQKIDLLIGAECFFEILSIGQIKLAPHLPMLQKTLLGWIVSGKYNLSYMPNSNSYSALTSIRNDDSPQCNVELNQQLNEIVQNFWKIENFDDKPPLLTQEQQYCQDFFDASTYQSTSGRIFTKLPFKSNKLELGDSFAIAKRRFYNLERKLLKMPDLKDQYSAFLNEYEDLDHMVVVPSEKQHLVKYYLPHHCVFKPDSSSTKIRVVFDGSCKTSSNLSLNDVLMVGPTVQDDLVSTLLRFRSHKYALKADICKMYRQIFIEEEDSFYQCILWRKNPNEDLRTYRLKTLTYGTASASFLATQALSYLASLHSEHLTVGADIIKRDFYVDDLITGASTLDEIETIHREVNLILKSGEMELKKWYSNNPNFLSKIPEDDREKLINIHGTSVIKTLGTCWQPSTDEFRFVVSELHTNSATITKRTVLSDLAKLFDPIGIVNPIIVRAKIFMQSLWLLKLDWDESLPMHLHADWSHFKSELPLLNNVHVPRYILCQSKPSIIELHGFADASSLAYGGCIYVRCVGNNGKISVKLLTSKSRVAPSKCQTIPRLELCAALLLANLMKKVQKNIKNVDNIILWSDSEIVLSWLTCHSSTLNIFVANRVSQIQELTHNLKWRHVNSSSNAADILSRGATVQDLINSNWFTGPSFLYKSEEYWPSIKEKVSNNNIPEIRSKYMSVFASKKLGDNSLLQVIEKFSSYNKIIAIFGFIMKFIQTLRANPSTCKTSESHTHTSSSTLTPAQREYALLKIIQILQTEYFASEIASIQKNDYVSSKSTIKSLNPLLVADENIELLRVGGRIDQAKIPYATRHPILLPKGHPFVKQLVHHLHLENLHAGPQALLAIVRQRFWIINGKSVVNSVVKGCIRCFRFKPKLINQIMGDIPADRLRVNRPFHISGVDFCGPIMTSLGVRGKRLYKSYVAVFVCFSTHAVHLEVVSSLSSDAFIAALKRFVARRGFCNRLYCDNATNFVGARTVLSELKNEFYNQQTQGTIGSWCSSKGISFHHIPPQAPHFGGIWESAVKSAKHHLTRALCNVNLVYDELATLVAQVEAILNSRPISPLSSDPSDEQPLTPGHFLIGEPLNSLPEKYISDTNVFSIKKFHRIAAIQQYFWKRWSSEYITSLQKRYKWSEASANVKVGNLVIVAEDNLPPQNWSLGRIVKLHPGKDARVRVVDVKIRKKIYRRQIHSLAPLPIYDVEYISTT